jgi:F-type H+-transporting ATPase subunit b
MNRLIVSSAVLLSSTIALAAEGAAGGHHEPHISNVWGIGAQYAQTPALGFLTITFLVFVLGLFFILRKPIAILVENRSDAVRKAIEEAQRAKAAAEARAKEAEAKLASLDDEMKRLRSDFEVQGKAEMARIEKLAEETAVRIAKDAEDTIAAESDRARQTLRAEAARLALELAEERIRAALSSDDDARLQKALIAGLDAPKQQPRA